MIDGERFIALAMHLQYYLRVNTRGIVFVWAADCGGGEKNKKAEKEGKKERKKNRPAVFQALCFSFYNKMSTVPLLHHGSLPALKSELYIFLNLIRELFLETCDDA